MKDSITEGASQDEYQKTLVIKSRGKYESANEFSVTRCYGDGDKPNFAQTKYDELFGCV